MFKYMRRQHMMDIITTLPGFVNMSPDTVTVTL
jgi:hypothetical protein